MTYDTGFGYISKLDPDRIFRTRDDATAYDRREAVAIVADQSIETLTAAIDDPAHAHLRAALIHLGSLAQEADDRARYARFLPTPDAAEAIAA